MKQLLLPENYDGSSQVEVTGRQYHYLVRVLRLKPGAMLPGLDRSGKKFDLILEEVQNDSALLKVMAAVPGEICSLPRITLVQCIPKGKKMDLVVRQAAEVGVHSIVPIISEYTIPQFSEKSGQEKSDRWNRIANEAAQQCGSPTILRVAVPATLESISSIKCDVSLFFHHLRTEAPTLTSLLHGDVTDIALCIGPEGGFSRKEVSYFTDLGYHPVFLNTNVLRTDTAALYAIAAVQTVLSEKLGWTKSF